MHFFYSHNLYTPTIYYLETDIYVWFHCYLECAFCIRLLERAKCTHPNSHELPFYVRSKFSIQNLKKSGVKWGNWKYSTLFLCPSVHVVHMMTGQKEGANYHYDLWLHLGVKKFCIQCWVVMSKSKMAAGKYVNLVIHKLKKKKKSNVPAFILVCSCI